MKSFDILLWDVDQTLLDFEKSQSYALRRCFEQLELEINDEIIKRYDEINTAFWKRLERGEVTREILFTGRFAQLFKELGWEERVSANETAPIYQKALGEVYYYLDDSLSLCRKLKGRVRQYAVTNGNGATQHNKLKLSGLKDVFEAVFVSEEIGYSKPAPEYFEECFKRIPDFDKERVLLVGDSLSSDIQGANQAGIACCWYNPGRKINDSGYRMDYEIQNLWEVEDILSCQNRPTRN